MTKTYIDELAEEIARLRDYYDKAITREREMATKFNNAYWENQQLKDLLKECNHMILAYSINHDTFPKEKVKDIVTKIEGVLK